jgi:hypothetical protein
LIWCSAIKVAGPLRYARGGATPPAESTTPSAIKSQVSVVSVQLSANCGKLPAPRMGAARLTDDRQHAAQSLILPSVHTAAGAPQPQSAIVN